MVDGCSHCQDLWRGYSEATTAHIRLDNKLKTAALKHDREAVELLRRDCDAAEQARREAREAMRRHEESAHGKTDRILR